MIRNIKEEEVKKDGVDGNERRLRCLIALTKPRDVYSHPSIGYYFVDSVRDGVAYVRIARNIDKLPIEQISLDQLATIGELDVAHLQKILAAQ